MLNKFKSDYNLKGKVALITGSAGLLGQEHAIALLEIGAKVIITDVNKIKLNKLYKKLKKKYHRVISSYLDVTSVKSINNLRDNLKRKKIKINILINNAAIDPKFKKQKKNNKFENFSVKQWNNEISVGLTGAMLCSQIIGTYMSENKGGIILNIASDLSVIAPNQNLYKTKGQIFFKPVTYSVIKTGIIGLTRYISTYWAKKNIRCNALSPGGVENNQKKHFKNKLKSMIPLNRMAKKNEYRGVIQFLCSNASSYMNGQNVVMDGGRSVW